MLYILFLSGFFLYSALFAAVGSAVDSETETQQFMFPITLPLLFTYILSFSFLINNPDSTLAVWLSIIPFTAPVAMMVRIPFGVPGWQLGLSMFMMVAGFIFTTYVAARIYRVGILMYGKKQAIRNWQSGFFIKSNRKKSCHVERQRNIYSKSERHTIRLVQNADRSFAIAQDDKK